jgi:hypothetical protein
MDVPGSGRVGRVGRVDGLVLRNLIYSAVRASCKLYVLIDV